VTNDPFQPVNLALVDNHNYADYAEYFYGKPHVLFFGKNDEDNVRVGVRVFVCVSE
jgi:hypothetical protein